MQDDADSVSAATREDGSPGWDAINDALAVCHPGVVPQHFGSAQAWTLGGDDPLDGISVYWATVPRPHWHYVTYGLSELFDKESEDLSESGFGFELTFRLAAPGDADAGTPAPAWPLHMLQNLARYVFQSGNGFEQGHHMDAQGPIALDHPTALCGLAFMRDPGLPARDTPNGYLRFVQVIGLAAPEMAAILRWSSERLLQALAPAMPLWITDLGRDSLLDDPAVAAQVDAGSQAEGSSTSLVLLEHLSWEISSEVAVELALGAAQVEQVRTLLPARLPYGQPLTLLSGDRSWTFVSGGTDVLLAADDRSARFQLSPTTLDSLLVALRPVRAHHRLAGGRLTVKVEASAIRDPHGQVVRTLG